MTDCVLAITITKAHNKFGEVIAARPTFSDRDEYILLIKRSQPVFPDAEYMVIRSNIQLKMVEFYHGHYDLTLDQAYEAFDQYSHKKIRLLVVQDGSQFYISLSEHANERPLILNSPFNVTDYDEHEAGVARQWFLGWCRLHNFDPQWV